jgi:hypothetical protein
VTVSATSGMSYWDGSGPVSFGAVPAGETLLLEKGSGSITVGNVAPPGSLTVSGSVPPDGEFDEHLSATLQGVGTSDPAAGIYLLTMELATNQPGVASSGPFWVLYNNGLDEGAGFAAVIFAHDTFAPNSNLAGVPEPSASSIAVLGCWTASGRHRRWGRRTSFA